MRFMVGKHSKDISSSRFVYRFSEIPVRCLSHKEGSCGVCGENG
jgi:hypothetical protein